MKQVCVLMLETASQKEAREQQIELVRALMAAKQPTAHDTYCVTCHQRISAGELGFDALAAVITGQTVAARQWTPLPDNPEEKEFYASFY